MVWTTQSAGCGTVHLAQIYYVVLGKSCNCSELCFSHFKYRCRGFVRETIKCKSVWCNIYKNSNAFHSQSKRSLFTLINYIFSRLSISAQGRDEDGTSYAFAGASEAQWLHLHKWRVIYRRQKGGREPVAQTEYDYLQRSGQAEGNKTLDSGCVFLNVTISQIGIYVLSKPIVIT